MLYIGVVDSSGMRYFYTTEEPEIQAGAISFGHVVTPYMVVPPRTRNFTIAGICSFECTKSVCYNYLMQRHRNLYKDYDNNLYAHRYKLLL